MPHERITYRRAQLYDEVWAEPVRVVAKRYGISDVALAKICRRLGVPLPGVGYWAKKSAGHEPPRASLPATTKGVLDELTVNRWMPATPRVTRSINPQSAAELELQRSSEPAIGVAATLVDPHPLVATARDRLFDRKPGDDGLVRCTAFRCLDVEVSPASLDRALRIMDALIKACEQRQFQVEVTPPAPKEVPGTRSQEPTRPPNTTRVLVDGEWIDLCLVERCDVERNPPPTPPKHLKPGWELDWWIRNHRPPKRYVPNGKLELLASSSSDSAKWRDYRRTKIEDRLGEIVAHLKPMAESAKAARLERERQQREYAEEQRRRAEAERKAWEDQRKLEEMQKTLGAWRLARDLREYVSEARRLVREANCEFTPEGSLGVMTQWVDDYTERIDPLASLRHEIARHVADRAREELTPTAAARLEIEREESAFEAELLERIASERRADEIRKHLATIRTILVEADAHPLQGSGFERFLRWSSAYADRIDPHSALREQIAKDRKSGAAPSTSSMSAEASPPAEQ